MFGKNSLDTEGKGLYSVKGIGEGLCLLSSSKYLMGDDDEALEGIEFIYNS